MPTHETQRPWARRLTSFWGLLGMGAGALALITLVAVLAQPGAEDIPPAEPRATTSVPVATRTLAVAVFDDTTDRPLTPDVELWVRGRGSWFPDLVGGGDRAELGAFPVGTPETLFVYPDGRDGAEIAVPFRMTAAMVSGSVRDQVTVTIADTTVTVAGPPLGARPLVRARVAPDAAEPAAPDRPYPADLVTRLRGEMTSTADVACILDAIAATISPADLEYWLDHPADDPRAAPVDRALLVAAIGCAN